MRVGTVSWPEQRRNRVQVTGIERDQHPLELAGPLQGADARLQVGADHVQVGPLHVLVSEPKVTSAEASRSPNISTAAGARSPTAATSIIGLRPRAADCRRYRSW